MLDIKEITTKEFDELMASATIRAFAVKYSPRGLFFLRDGEKVVGIDNSTGHAWTEEFNDLDTCKRWLRGENLEDLMEEGAG